MKQEIAIGRGKKYCVAGELHSKYARKLKIKDSIVDYLKKYAERARIDKFEIVNEKLLVLRFKKTFSFVLYYESHELKFKSFENEKSLNDYVEIALSIPIQSLEWNQLADYDKEVDSLFQKKYKNETKSKSNKEKKIKQDLAAIEKTINFSQELKNDSIQLQDSLELPLKKIKFEKNMSHWQKRDKVFSFIKKLKTVKEIQVKRLEEVQKSLSSKNVSSVFESQEFKLKEKIRVNWKIETKVSSHWDKWKYKDHLIYVGKSAKGNDELIKKYFSNEDCWGHPDEVAGPHIIIKAINPDQISQELVDALCSLVEERYNCTFKNIIFCRKNDLRRVSGKLGQVQLRESTKRTYKFQPEWGNNLSLVEA